MFFVVPALSVVAIHILAAVLPAIVLLRYVYRHDRVEKEPVWLLMSLLLTGVISAVCSSLIEGVFQTVLGILVEPDSLLYTILLAFFAVALVEEGIKLFFLNWHTWNHPAFNYRFDGIVYAVFVSLGFAAYENIQYVLHYGLSVALPRALLAVPGHMSFAVCMGIFYGRARLCRNQGNWIEEERCRREAWIWPMLLHGFYDVCAMIGTGVATIVFLVFVLLLFLWVYRSLKRESARDMPV